MENFEDYEEATSRNKSTRDPCDQAGAWHTLLCFHL
jgi:hypothetical protein